MNESIESPSVPVNILRKPAQALIATGSIYGVWSIFMFFAIQEGAVHADSRMGAIGLTCAFLSFIATAVILYGAVQMLNVRDYKWSRAAAIAAIVGSLMSAAGILLLPCGVWALYTLRSPQSKALFTRTPC